MGQLWSGGFRGVTRALPVEAGGDGWGWDWLRFLEDDLG